MKYLFDKKWFAKHQRVLLWLANSFLGELVFKFKKYGHYTEHKIVKITPNSVGELVKRGKKKVIIKEHFFSRNEYASRIFEVFYPVWWLAHQWDTLFANRFVPELNLGFDTLTVYPDAHPESTSVDGEVLDWGYGATWAAHVAAAGNSTGLGDNGTQMRVLIGGSGGTSWWGISRCIALFDTSALTADATISAATASFFGAAKTDPLTNTPQLGLVSSNPATNTAIVAGDYATLGTTLFASYITYAGFSTTAYNDYAMNASGLAAISKTAITKLGLRTDYDITNTAPANNGGSTSDFTMVCADTGSNKPKLVITYTAGTKHFLSSLGAGS